MKYTNEEMIADMHRVESIVDGPLSRPKYREHGRIHPGTISTRFGGWLAAIEAAGLEPAYQFGGTWFDCPICGNEFRSDNGAKSRRTCSPECAREKMSRSRTKPLEEITPQAARGRARDKLDPEKCNRCGDDGGRIEVHHRDGDPYNNDLSNLEALCVSCHRRHHDKLNGGRNRRAQFTDDELLDRIRDWVREHGRVPSYDEFRTAGTLSRRFGSWPEAVRAAGFEPVLHWARK